MTVIVPARNEEADIAGCIDAIGGQDHPAERTQLIVVDGASTDRTVDEVKRAAARYPFAEARILDNPLVRTSVGLDRGLGGAR